MRTPPPFAHTVMDMAFKMAERSKDPSTQVGAVIVDRDKNIVSTGYNGAARGVHDTPERYERPTKYGFVVHAEANAVFAAARRGVSTEDGTIYVTHTPCSSCADAIIQAGITCVVIGPGLVKGDWSSQMAGATARFNEAGVVVEMIDEGYAHADAS